MDEYLNWLKTYFASRGSIAKENIEELNYFEAGLIDSFGIIELIEVLEKEFNIKFSALHFQDRRFSSIRGLAEIILELKID